MDASTVMTTLQEQLMGFLQWQFWIGSNLGSLVHIIIFALIVWLIVAILEPKMRNAFRRGRKGDTVLILGQCNAGKTALFIQLIHRRSIDTVSSMIQNKAKMGIIGKMSYPVQVVDFPGHQRLQYGVFNIIPSVKCIVYVLDATDKGTLKTAADQILKLVASKRIASASLKILIACNKADLSTARTVSMVKKELENEIDNFKSGVATGTAYIEDEEEESDQLAMSRASNVSFKFEDSPVSVEFCSCSALKGDVEAIKDFIVRSFDNA